MKAQFELDEKDIKEAIRRYVKEAKKIEAKEVTLYQYVAASNDPREYSYFYAKVSE